MTVQFKKSFFKDYRRLPSHVRGKVKEIVFEKLPEIYSISEIKNSRKLKGYTDYYRIRIGD